MRRILKCLLLCLLLLAVYLAAGAVIPYVSQPEITAQTKTEFSKKNFLGEGPSGERAKVISDNGEALAERIRLISQAKERIILSTFEFRSDVSGKAVLSALIAAERRGVQISVLVDGFPCLTSMEGDPYFYALSALPGAQIRVYNPAKPWEPWNFMGRMHDKYLIVDETAYILGGRNTYDYFLGDQPGHKNYDWDVLVYGEEGKPHASMEQLLAYFNSVWELPVCEAFHDNEVYLKRDNVQEAAKALRTCYEKLQKDHSEWFEPCDYTALTRPAAHIELLKNPITVPAKEPVVFYEMTQLMMEAEKEVSFHTPYIICDDWMLERLSEVCSQTDRVEMMTNSAANNGNPFGAMDYQNHKEKILKTGVSILEYDGGISYHGKCFTIDERLSGIGSFNWDMRSAYLDTELMLVIDSRELNKDLKNEMDAYKGKALRVLDMEHAELPNGHTPREIPAKRQYFLDFLHFFGGWARFLM
ncbi:MAG: phospholipase D family protein [Lachnospiraceae bacterium]|nr:phospholipase D family protein [Lachnospiraceae bacterium]